MHNNVMDMNNVMLLSGEHKHFDINGMWTLTITLME